MRKIVAATSVTGMIAVIALATLGARATPDRWEKVEEARRKGLPKTALKELVPILQEELRQKDYPWAIRALCLKINLETQIQGNKPEERIRRLQSELEKMPEPMQPVLRAVLAEWYWQFYQQNRWRFMQRTQAGGADEGDDLMAWSLPRILKEIDSQFQAALRNEDQLRQIPLGRYEAILEKGNAPAAYRPTLFDFLAFEAVKFYAAGEQAASVPANAFVLTADSPVFAPVRQFLKWEIDPGDGPSPHATALQLYQRILRAHQDDDDRSAFIDADLGRLVFAGQAAVGTEKDARYRAALERFTRVYGDHPITARAFHHWAASVHADGDWVEARKIALRGIQRAPKSVGANRCRQLVAQIEAKSVNVSVERVWNEPWPKAQVTYRNIKELYFRIVRFDADQFIQSKRYGPEQLSNLAKIALINQRPVKAWKIDLEPTRDYKSRSTEFDVPPGLAKGAYYIIASPAKDFGVRDNVVSFAHFWVSDLGVVIRTDYRQGVIDGVVTNAITGEPLAEANIVLWAWQNQTRAEAGRLESGEDGRFTIRSPGRPLLIDVRYGDDRVVSGQYDNVGRYRGGAENRDQTYFFTDRAIYRPGQTIQFKGIALSLRFDRDEYRALPGKSITVALRDANRKEVARREFRTNEFGSFAGSFTAPSGKLLGMMTLDVVSGPRGSQYFRVEEYKRPKFRVDLNEPKDAPQLDRPVTVTGTAKAYTGAPIDGAQVWWRVVRRSEIPYWWLWECGWFYYSPPAPQEIASGVSKTDALGNFEVTFPATPDPSVDNELPARFYFEVSADVIDSTGETRSAQRSIVVGRRLWWANVSTDEWQEKGEPVAWRIRLTKLNGSGVQAQGKLRVYRLKQPRSVIRASLWTPGPRPASYRNRKATAPPSSDVRQWEVGELVTERDVETDAAGNAVVSVKLDAGPYRAVFETTDPSGGEVEAKATAVVLDPSQSRLDLRVPFLVRAKTWRAEPGETLRLLWGTGYRTGRALIEVEHRGKMLQRFWTDSRKTQQVIEVPIDESMRGGFTVHVTMVRENRLYQRSQRVEVPWTNKQLTLKWEHFVSKLKPGQHETWTLIIQGPPGKDGKPTKLKAAAELVATLYDASLEAFVAHRWTSLQQLFRYDYSTRSSRFYNHAVRLSYMLGQFQRPAFTTSLTYPSFHRDIVPPGFGRRGFLGFGGGGPGVVEMMDAAAAPAEMEGAGMGGAPPAARNRAAAPAAKRQVGPGSPSLQLSQSSMPDVKLDEVAIRKNLQETAFFYPQLRTDEEGRVRIEFTMPEALTEWRFMGMAHDPLLRSGIVDATAVTRKDLMVQPNPPRFLRENDSLEFTVKVVNQSATRQAGKVRLKFFDARTNNEVTAQLGIERVDQDFDIAAGRSQTYSWRVHVPDGMGFLVYRAVAASERLSDGEEGYVPVLPRRVLVTESLPLPIRGPQEKQWEWKRFMDGAQSDSIVHQSLTVQAVSQPAWYAVLALPYLMEFPHECSEQVFNRVYANLLARQIITSDPKIRRIVDQWRNTPAELSPLEKNQDLKAVLLEETPWVRQAEAETQARKNLGILFDENRIASEVRRAMDRLRDTQLADGAWPWFPGGSANDYITMYIVTGFARLDHLGVDVDLSLAHKALPRLDRWLQRRYDHIRRHGDLKKNNLTPIIAFYLYGRSFYVGDHPIPEQYATAVGYFWSQAEKHWLTLPRQSQGHVALAAHRTGKHALAQAIMRSIKEHSVEDEELGMFWRDTERSWWWYRAPIETQALMIEAFDEVMNDKDAVDGCQVWLIKQKQTQDWKTTKATADACYALLGRGHNRLASDVLLEVTLDGYRIEPRNVEAGTGFFEERIPVDQIKPDYGKIKVVKRDEGVAWASVHWQYLEDVSKVKPYEGTPLTLRKSLHVKRLGKNGYELQPLGSGVQVGDQLVVRVELRVDRDMEYVHLKDQRPSGSEPVDVLSGYRYQDGLAYYQMTRDTATHFFIDYLPKGTYVFEYVTRIQHRGRYQSGMATIQCMYAPEFNSHSGSTVLEVK